MKHSCLHPFSFYFLKRRPFVHANSTLFGKGSVHSASVSGDNGQAFPEELHVRSFP